MAKFAVIKDIALLDKGVSEYGSLIPQSLQLAKRALSNEEV